MSTASNWSRKSAWFASVALVAVLLAASAGAASGDLDTSFGNGGLVSTDFAGFQSETARAIVTQPDGKLVVAGNAGIDGANARFALARYNADGSLDPTFDTDGLVVTDFAVSGTSSARAVVLQPDGKIVAAGGVGYIPSGLALARYNADGSLDTTFDGDGRAVTGFPPSPSSPSVSSASAIVLQPDGKLIVAGTTGNCRFLLARYTPDGTLDPTFDGDGLAAASSHTVCEASALVLQDDGKPVVAGGVSTNFSGSELVFGLARFNTDGSLDTSFSGDGVVTTNFLTSSQEAASALIAQPDGKLVAAGFSALFGLQFALARYDENGDLDPTFDEDGLVEVDLPSSTSEMPLALVRQSNGKLVAAGYATVSDARFALVRFRADGQLDSSYGTNGLVETDFVASGQEFARALVVQPDGNLVAAGGGAFPHADGFGGFALARYVGQSGTADETPPTLTIPSQVAVDATSPAGAIVAYEATATDDVDGPVPVTCAPPSSSLLPIGDTTAECEASDSSGNAAHASLNVHVKGAVEQIGDLMAAVAATPAAGLNFMLNRALQAIATGQTARACTELATFVRTVYDLARPPRPQLTNVQAYELTTAGRRIRAVLAC